MKKNIYSSTWTMKTKIENYTYENINFIDVDFNHPIFDNVNFINCRFQKCNFDDTRTYNCNFDNCFFEKIDFRGVSVGAHGGTYKGCTFFACNFQKLLCHAPNFINCFFDNCKLKGWEPSASYFESCKIKGKISEVTFYDSYENSYREIRNNLFYSIDFSEAIFGEYVIFECCDLSLSSPPKGYTFDELLVVEYPSSRKFNIKGKGTPSD